MVSGSISNLMLSRISETAFAAGLFINTIQLILVTVIFGLLSSISPLIGKVMGQEKQSERVGPQLQGHSYKDTVTRTQLQGQAPKVMQGQAPKVMFRPSTPTHKF